MSTYNPFTSQQTLAQFLTGLKPEDQSYNERGISRQNPIASFADTQQAQNQIPLFTDDPQIARAMQGYLVEEEKAKLEQDFDLPEITYDLEGFTDSFDAYEAAQKLESDLKIRALDIEKKLFDSMGIGELQKQYEAAINIPGVMDFESTATRAQALQAKLETAQNELQQKISAGRDGTIKGEFADYFTRGRNMVEALKLRGKRLERDEQIKRKGNVVLSAEEREKRSFDLRNGGTDKIVKLAEVAQITPDEVRDKLRAGWFDEDYEILVNYEERTGNKMPLDMAYAELGTTGYETVLSQHKDMARAIGSIDPEVFDTMKLKADNYAKGLIEQGVQDHKQKNGNAPKAKDVAEIRKSSNYMAMRRVLDETKKAIKRSEITPERYSLMEQPVSKEIKNAAQFLMEMDPELFKYDETPGAMKEKVKKAGELYNRARVVAPTLPSFFDVYGPMLQSMVTSMSSDFGLIDPMIVDPTDPVLMEAVRTALYYDSAKARGPEIYSSDPFKLDFFNPIFQKYGIPLGARFGGEQ